jgi:hypothetical protein
MIHIIGLVLSSLLPLILKFYGLLFSIWEGEFVMWKSDDHLMYITMVLIYEPCDWLLYLLP